MATSRPSTQERRMVVAAIDFGTTCTGYAYYLPRDQATNIEEINTNQAWLGSAQVGHQAPTTVLMNTDKSFHSFGFEAEDEYKNLTLLNKHKGWYFFRHFKMKLHHEKNLSRDMMMTDASGKQMKAMIIFTEAIKYVKKHLLERLKQSLKEAVGVNEITWVLTVPAIWRHSAKQFMREAASKAGIPSAQLSLALEPESAAIFCKEQALNRVGGVDGVYLRAFDPGEKYIVVDCGGGTLDTTGHEVQQDGTLKELHAATGGPFGGKLVNDAFENFIADLVTRPVFQDFVQTSTHAWIELEEDFETVKRKYSTNKNDATLRFPQILATKYEEASKISLEERLKETKYKNKVQFVQGHLILKSTVMDELFKKATDEINIHIDGLLKKKELKSVSTLLLVGGFSESPIVSEAVRKYFPKLRVVAPTNGSIAILKGAVMFGGNSKVISVRMSPFTYGVHTRKVYVKGLHPPERARKVGSRTVVNNAFDKHLEIGQRVYVGSSTEGRKYKITNKGNPTVFWNVYQSTILDPLFCDDEYRCTYIGRLNVDLSCVEMEGRDFVSLLLSMTCKGTELEASAFVEELGLKEKAKFDFLDTSASMSEDIESM